MEYRSLPANGPASPGVADNRRELGKTVDLAGQTEYVRERSRPGSDQSESAGIWGKNPAVSDPRKTESDAPQSRPGLPMSAVARADWAINRPLSRSPGEPETP